MAIDRRETGRRGDRGRGDKETGRMRNKKYFHSSPYPPFSMSPFSISLYLWLNSSFRTSEVVLTFPLIAWKICALTNPKFHKLRFHSSSEQV
jgi:hypothetical protein